MDDSGRYVMRELIIPDSESLAAPELSAEDPLISETFSKEESADDVVSYRMFALRYTGPTAADATLVSRRQVATLRVAAGKVALKGKADTRLVALLSALLAFWAFFWIYRAVNGWRCGLLRNSQTGAGR